MDNTISCPEITKEFLEEAVGYPIASFKVETGSNPGDNYMSNLFGITIAKKSNPNEKEHLLMKCFPNHPARQDFLHKCNIFYKEVAIYSQWVPLLQGLLKEHGEELPFAPYLAGHSIDFSKENWKETVNKNNNHGLENFLLFTDLRKSDQYRMGDRTRGLDLHHCELVMKELAKVHSMSWVYKQKHNIHSLPEKFPFFKESMFGEEMDEDFESMKGPMIAHNLNMIEKAFGGVNAKEYIAAKEFFDRDITVMCKLVLDPSGVDEDAMEDILRVKPSKSAPGYSKERWLFACHGDSWVNNFLFKYDDSGKPVQLKIVDLQIFRDACPTTDLAYFFYSSTIAELRKNHLDHLLNLYYTEFARHCKIFDTELPPSFDFPTLKRRFHRAKIWGLCLAIFLLQIVLTPPEQSKNLDAEDEGKDMTEVFTGLIMSEESNSNTNLQGRLKEVVSELYEAGVI